MKDPSVTVLLPVYNCRRYLLAALRSILRQDYGDFELLVINDGSTDGSDALARSIDDPRIRVIDQPHGGIVSALTRGLAEARAELVARMDGDDIALPQRLGLQVSFMREHPRVHLLGSRFVYMDARGRLLFSPEWPSEDSEIRRFLPVFNCFTHPTVMFRRQSALAVGGYRRELEYQEDYDLWLRMIERFEAAQLPEVLLYYRLSSDSVSFKYRHVQSTVLDGLVKELRRQRELEGRDVLERGGDISTLRRSLEDAAGVLSRRRRWARQLIGWGEGSLHAGQRTAALRFALQALWSNPLTSWSWSLLARCVVPTRAATMILRGFRAWRAMRCLPVARPVVESVRPTIGTAKPQREASAEALVGAGE